MAIAFVKKGGTAHSASGKPIILSVPTGGVSAGQFMVLIAACANGDPLTPSTSKSNVWALVSRNRPTPFTTNVIMIAYAYATNALTAGTSITVQCTNSPNTAKYANAVLYVFSGVASSAFDKYKTTAWNTTQTTYATATLAPALSGELFIAGIVSNVYSATSQTFTPSTPFTKMTWANPTRTHYTTVCGAYYISSNSTSRTCTWTPSLKSAFTNTAAILVAFKPTVTSTNTTRFFSVIG